MNAKHTKGPWAAYGEHEFWAVETERLDNGKSEQIATCYSEANARLIAASPELLEALELAEKRDEEIHAFDDLECFVDDFDTHRDYIAEYQRRAKQRAAIAKATGR